MSFWSYLFDNEFSQRQDINNLRATSRVRARQLRRQTRESRERLQELEEEVGELALLTRALLTYLRESGGIDPEKFAEVLERVDLDDGVLDGKLGENPPHPSAPHPPKRRHH